MKPTIVEGIIAVANHKLRVEGIESYKDFLAEEYFSVEDILKLIDEWDNFWDTHLRGDVGLFWWRDKIKELEQKFFKDNKQDHSHQEDSEKPVIKVATPKSEIGLDIPDGLNSNEEVTISLDGEQRKGMSEMGTKMGKYLEGEEE